MSVAYAYDGTLDGLFTAVFEAYNRKEDPCVIAREDGLQTAFGREIIVIETDEEKSRRVEKGIYRSIGGEAYQQVWTAFLSQEPDKATILYRYLRLGFSIGRTIYNYLTHEDVLAVNTMCRNTGHEAHLLKGFVRFSLTEGGVYYAKITPKNSVLPLIMPHFADRYASQPFLIHDPSHSLVGVYDLNDWYMVETTHLDVPKPSEDELAYRRLWKQFYETVAVMERYNPKCRRTLMPKRFWPNMTEFSFTDRQSPHNNKKTPVILRG